jgi:hypothetical protein
LFFVHLRDCGVICAGDGLADVGVSLLSHLVAFLEPAVDAVFGSKVRRRGAERGRLRGSVWRPQRGASGHCRCCS